MGYDLTFLLDLRQNAALMPEETIDVFSQFRNNVRDRVEGFALGLQALVHHRPQGIADRVLQASDAALDLHGGLVRITGQLFDLGGNHGEALAGRAGSGRLDGRIECKHVGLPGNVSNLGDDVGKVSDYAVDFTQALLTLGASLIATFPKFIEKAPAFRDVRLGPANEIGHSVGHLHLVKKRNHALDRSIDLIQTGKDLQCGTFGLDTDLRKMVAKDAEQFLVMTKLPGGQQCLRGEDVGLPRGDGGRCFVRHGNTFGCCEYGSSHGRPAGTLHEVE